VGAKLRNFLFATWWLGATSPRVLFVNFTPPKRRFWKDGQQMKMRIFEALFKVMSTRFWLRTVENSIENPHFIFCSSFQNPRLGSIKLAIRDLHVSVFAYRACDRLAPLTVNGANQALAIPVPIHATWYLLDAGVFARCIGGLKLRNLMLASRV
jgi:hypothetical protein